MFLLLTYQGKLYQKGYFIFQMSVMTNVTIPLGTLFDNEYMVLLRYRGNAMQILATVRLTQPRKLVKFIAYFQDYYNAHKL